ncbi:hypothetical protein GCM10020331_011940 [Ectobacillus funiculus]
MFTIVSSARTHAENATDRVAYVAANKVEQAKDLSEKKGIGHAIQRIKKNKQSNAREQNQGAKGTQAQGAANPAAASSHSAKSSDKRESPSGTASSSTVASTAPVKQSSVRDNQK